MNSSDDSASMTVALGRVVVPSRTVVLACGGFLDQWADLGKPLSARVVRAADTGGAVPPPSGMRQRERTTLESWAEGSWLLPRCG